MRTGEEGQGGWDGGGGGGAYAAQTTYQDGGSTLLTAAKRYACPQMSVARQREAFLKGETHDRVVTDVCFEGL